MAGTTEGGGGRRIGRRRMAAWGAAALLLLAPWFAMQVTDQVDWSVADFAVFGALLAGAGAAYELAARKTGDTAYRAAVALALAAAFILVWVNGAVGIIGAEDDPANRMYFGVLAVGVVGALIARFRPGGMVRALSATALAQALAAGIALIAGLGRPASGPAEIVAANGFFIVLFIGSAWLFRRAGRGGGERGAS